MAAVSYIPYGMACLMNSRVTLAQGAMLISVLCPFWHMCANPCSLFWGHVSAPSSSHLRKVPLQEASFPYWVGRDSGTTELKIYRRFRPMGLSCCCYATERSPRGRALGPGSSRDGTPAPKPGPSPPVLAVFPRGLGAPEAGPVFAPPGFRHRVNVRRACRAELQLPEGREAGPGPLPHDVFLSPPIADAFHLAGILERSGGGGSVKRRVGFTRLASGRGHFCCVTASPPWPLTSSPPSPGKGRRPRGSGSPIRAAGPQAGHRGHFEQGRQQGRRGGRLRLRGAKQDSLPVSASARKAPFQLRATAQPHKFKRVWRSLLPPSPRPSSRFRFNAIFKPHPPVPTDTRAGGSAETAPGRQRTGRRRLAMSEEQGGEHLSVLGNQVKHPLEIKRKGPNTEETEFLVLRKRRRIASSVENNTMSAQEPDYEDNGDVVYEYEPDYECGSVVSEESYRGHYQKTLMEVLNYCEAMYDAIQKLDKKFDLLHGKVSEMQRARMKPLLLKPRPVGFTYRSSNHVPHGKIRVQKPVERESSIQISPPGQGDHSQTFSVVLPQNPVQTDSVGNSVEIPIKSESQQQDLRQSPPLPTIVSTHSLYQPFMGAANKIPDLSLQSQLLDTVVENTDSAAESSPVVTTQPEACVGRDTVMMDCPSSQENESLSQEVLSSSTSVSPSFEYIGDPKRNVKVLGTYLMKARQKTKPKYAARYLVQVLFPMETLLCSVMGASAQGRSTLDPNKVAAVREFLATHFPNYDLSECGRDWKTCITNVNSMIRCLCCKTKIKPQETENKDKLPVAPDSSVCVELNCNDKDGGINSQVSQKTTALETNGIQSSTRDSNSLPEVLQAPSSKKLPSLEPMQLLGYPWRNVQLPFSVIYVAKGKSRPELSARYLIRHLFTEEVLVKSNVYGSLERGVRPLDCNRIHALRDFLQENYPSYDLTETGYDWKACVAAINSTIRSLRHDHKKATRGFRRKTSVNEKNPS
ncbi:BEN domain-containing protein 2 [Petaurus breviceps papuanus]|uniref:BEN domain-containing protein 2 n=1 Tax=Petaurus breviceps papuanus TaxID=3040969 RepID=UPI0036DDCBD3